MVPAQSGALVAHVHRPRGALGDSACARVSRRVTIVRSGLTLPAAAPDEQVVIFEDFRNWVRHGTVLAHIGRYREGRLLVHRIESAGRPLPLGLPLRAMSSGAVRLEDTRARHRALTRPDPPR